MDFAVRDDLVKVGVSEDGEDELGLVYYVIARGPDGRQWAHNRSFLNKQKRYDPEDGVYFYRDDEGKASRQVAHLLSQITEAVAHGGQPNFAAHWNEIDPAYGSDAYQELDAMHYFRDTERMRDEERECFS